jgi:hypothetical protein
MHDGVAGVVSISSPGFWMRADRPASQRLVRIVQGRGGRALAAALLRTRIDGIPEERAEIDAAVAGIAPAFTLLVHDPDDQYFGAEHAEHLYEVAREPKDLWWVPGAGHGIDVLTPAFADRLVDELSRRFRAPSQ